MTEAATEKMVCWSCGADIRPNTQFCYSCGKALDSRAADDLDSKDDPANESLADLERALAASRMPQDPKSKLDSAAAKRRLARQGARKQAEAVWEPAGPSVVYFVAALVIFLLAAVVVLMTRAAR